MKRQIFVVAASEEQQERNLVWQAVLIAILSDGSLLLTM